MILGPLARVNLLLLTTTLISMTGLFLLNYLAFIIFWTLRYWCWQYAL